VVLSDGLWKRRFGADRGIIGKTLTLNGDAFTVIGVLPRGFIFPGQLDAEIATPLLPDADPNRTDRDANFIRAFGRLKPGTAVHKARADLASVANHLREIYPITNAKKTAPHVWSMRSEIVGGYQTALLMLLGAVALVLLIACANLANLLLARGAIRRREFALRIALGATGSRLIKQLLTESLILAGLGGVLGLALAWMGIGVLVSFSPAGLPRANEIGIDWRVCLFTLAISVLAGAVFGVIPAIQASKTGINEMIKSAGRGPGDSIQMNRTRAVLVVSEVALSLVLLITAGLLTRSFRQVQKVSSGCDTHNLLLATVSLPHSRYVTGDDVRTFYERVSSHLHSLPGVRAVGAINVVPLSGLNNRTEFTIVGRAPASPTDIPGAQNRWAGPNYFNTMGIPVIKGREFTDRDTPATRHVVVVDQALADRFWPNGDPIGAHLRIGYDGDPEPRDVEVVGVAGNVKHFTLEEDPLPTIYAPFNQIPKGAVFFGISNRMTLLLRTSADPLTLTAAVRHAVQEVDPDIPTTGVKTMDEMLASAIAPRQFNATLFMIFSLAALMLAASGVYAVVSYSVTQATAEIGIRMCLGCSRAEVLKFVAGKGLPPVLLGVLVGLAGAFGISQVMSGLLFHVSATDPYIFMVVPLVLLTTAIIAVFIPARRAARLDPMVALRES
ncbi:MAG TPA: ABC transporter permease, partial [Blastocatellia bacterium]|nr:ABC transporter permease [Blastocatellia bacterium]